MPADISDLCEDHAHIFMGDTCSKCGISKSTYKIQVLADDNSKLHTQLNTSAQQYTEIEEKLYDILEQLQDYRVNLTNTLYSIDMNIIGFKFYLEQLNKLNNRN